MYSATSEHILRTVWIARADSPNPKTSDQAGGAAFARNFHQAYGPSFRRGQRFSGCPTLSFVEGGSSFSVLRARQRLRRSELHCPVGAPADRSTGTRFALFFIDIVASFRNFAFCRGLPEAPWRVPARSWAVLARGGRRLRSVPRGVSRRPGFSGLGHVRSLAMSVRRSFPFHYPGGPFGALTRRPAQTTIRPLAGFESLHQTFAAEAKDA